MSIHFGALCAHHQEIKILLYSIRYHHTWSWPSRAQFERRLVKSSLNLHTVRIHTSYYLILYNAENHMMQLNI